MSRKVTDSLLKQTLDDPRSPYFPIVNDILAAATLISICAIVLETVPSFGAYHVWFLMIEWATVAIFTLEYGLRLVTAKQKRTYALSFFGIIDLIAIAPTFLGLGNFSFLKSARIVRIMRFLRMVRLAKMSRVEVEDVEETMGIFGFNIALYVAALLLVMMAIGTSLHIFVGTETAPWSIPGGMYWAFAVFLGGLPAPVPPGGWGTFIFIVTKFCGMILFGFLVGLVGKVFNQLILGKK